MLVVHLTECQGAEGGRGIEDNPGPLNLGQNIHPWFEWSTSVLTMLTLYDNQDDTESEYPNIFSNELLQPK